MTTKEFIEITRMELRLETDESQQEVLRANLAVAERYGKRRAQNAARLLPEPRRREDVEARKEAVAAAKAARERKNSDLAKTLKYMRGAVDKAARGDDAPDFGIDSFGLKAAIHDFSKELRAHEIRQSLAGLDPLKIAVIYRDASQEIRDAIESAPLRVTDTPGKLPTLSPWIDPAEIQAQKMGAASLSAPDLVEQLRAVESLQRTVNRVADVLIASLREEVPEGPDEPLRLIHDGVEVEIPAPSPAPPTGN